NVATVPDKKVDSMLAAFTTAKEDTSKVAILLDLSAYYTELGDLNKALQYAEQGLALTERKTFAPKRGSAYLNVGYILQLQTKYKEAESCYVKALAFFEERNNKTGIARTNHLWGVNHYSMENYP